MFFKARQLLIGATIACSATLATFPASGEPAADAGVNSPGKRSYVPVPEHARGPAMPAKGYLLDDLGGGVYGFRSERENSMFMVTRTGVVVVDAPPEDRGGMDVMKAIREVTQLPITHFIYSHPHSDHVGGAVLFQHANRNGSSPIYIAHELAAQRIRAAADPRRPIPQVTFSGKRYVLETGGQTLYLDYHGDLHSAGDLFIYAPRQKVLMLTDVLSPRWAPYFKLGHTPNVPLSMNVAKLILAYDFRTFVGGHVGWFGTRDDIETIDRYLADLDRVCKEVYATYKVDFSAVEPANAWARSQTSYETRARVAAERMPKHWLTELGGADVFLFDNAHSLIFSLFTDYSPASARP